jgi:hypothetical protein
MVPIVLAAPRSTCHHGSRSGASFRQGERERERKRKRERKRNSERGTGGGRIKRGRETPITIEQGAAH